MDMVFNHTSTEPWPATGDFEPFKDQLDAANNAGCGLN